MSWWTWTLAAVLAAGCGRVTGSMEGDEPDSAVLSDGGNADTLSTSDGGFDCGGCAFGCNTTMDGCARIDPSNGLAAALDMAAAEMDLVVPAGTTLTFNTDDGTFACDPAGCDTTIGTFTTVVQDGLPDITVFIFKSFTIQSGGIVKASGEHSLAIVTSGPIAIEGLLDVRPPDVLASGRAGGSPAVGSLPRDPSTDGAGTGAEGGGGGGGGTGGAGAQGGNGRQTDNGVAAAGMAGAKVQVGPELVPLIGGKAGGGTGGGGGGAVQLVSATRIDVPMGGAINAGAGGGIGTNLFTGGGGGGGGAILLESAVIDINGNLAANGGGGSSLETSGFAGRSDRVPAAGGSSSDPKYRVGGAGAAGAAAPVQGDGAGAGSGRVWGGGGGGGIGHVRANTPGGNKVTLGASQVVSPGVNQGPVGVRD